MNRQVWRPVVFCLPIVKCFIQNGFYFREFYRHNIDCEGLIAESNCSIVSFLVGVQEVARKDVADIELLRLHYDLGLIQVVPYLAGVVTAKAILSTCQAVWILSKRF